MELSGIGPAYMTRPDALSKTPNLPQAGGVDNETAAREMEALFVSQLMKAMRTTIPEGGALKGGRGEEIARTMQDEAIGKSVAATGGFGLADQILMDLNRISANKPEQMGEPNGAD